MTKIPFFKKHRRYALKELFLVVFLGVKMQTAKKNYSYVQFSQNPEIPNISYRQFNT